MPGQQLTGVIVYQEACRLSRQDKTWCEIESAPLSEDKISGYYYYDVTVTYDVHQLYYMQTVFCPHQTTGHWNYTRQEARHGLVYSVQLPY